LHRARRRWLLKDVVCIETITASDIGIIKEHGAISGMRRGRGN
jgi:hypothetical protein